MKKINILMILLGLFLFVGCDRNTLKENDNQITPNNNEIHQDQENQNQGSLTPEEVLQQLNEMEGVGKEQGPITVTIKNPEGESFMPGQARMYRAYVDGLETGFRCVCNWKFYLNQREEEFLYKEQETPCTGNYCGFTTTFIDKIGKLRVHVDVAVKNRDEEIVQSGFADREYFVR